MNKVILGLILAVCVLGMALVMLNERYGRKPDSMPEQQQTLTENRQIYRPAQTSVIEPVPEMNVVPAPTRADTVDEPQLLASDSSRVKNDSENPIIEEVTAPGHQLPAAASKETNPSDAQTGKPVPVQEQQAVAQAGESGQATEQPAKKQEKAGSGGKITNFVVFSREKGATVRIAGNGRLSHKHMVLSKPDRIVMDLDGKWQFPATPGIPKNELVNNIRIGTVADKTRVVIDLKTKPRLTKIVPAKSGNSLDIRIDR